MISGTKAGVVFVVAASLLGYGAKEVYAGNLFDMLFGGSRLKKVRLHKPKPKRTVRRARIRGPSYYTYRADSLAKVEFSGIVAGKRDVLLLPTLDNDHFDEAVASLSGYTLSADKKIAEALADYYTENRSFIWVTGYNPNGKARSALSVLADADNWGLKARDYTVETPSDSFSLDDIPGRQRELVRFEMSLSARALRICA